MHVRYFILKYVFIWAEVDRTAVVRYLMDFALTSPQIRCILASMPDNPYSLRTQFFAFGSEKSLFYKAHRKHEVTPFLNV